MSGFGTVVTGTLSDGHFTVGDEVEILPSGLKGRIRGLQTHKKKEETAMLGSRTAVNISGINTELIQRGEVVVHPNQYQATRRVDARFRLLKDASSSIKHGDEVKFFVGASETIATLRLLGTEELLPGEEGWIQLELRDPVVTVRGDKYILRRPSPSETLGGGVIIDHQPKGRHKRFNEDTLKSLESLTQGSPADILFEAALSPECRATKRDGHKIAPGIIQCRNCTAGINTTMVNLIILEDGAANDHKQFPCHCPAPLEYIERENFANHRGISQAISIKARHSARGIKKQAKTPASYFQYHHQQTDH